jgi:hypothetical protein
MEKLTGLRVSPDWERSLLACLDRPPPRVHDARHAWAAGVGLLLAAIAGAAVWFIH